MEKKIKFVLEKTCKKYTILVFLRELLACHLITKFCTRLVHPSILDAKKFHMFLNFLAIFWIYYSMMYIFIVFLCRELLECPNNMKICTHLANLSTFDPTKFQIFLTFFAIFSRWSKLFDQMVTAQKGISIRATNCRGANLSTHWN